MSKSVVVIGGGVIGTSCAHFLSKAGWRVTVIDRGTIGGGSSAANCGFVCPSHVLPLAEPGMVLEGVKSLLHKNSPLKIKLRPDPALWSWLIHFALRCNERDMLASARGIQPLLDASLSLYKELVASEGLDCEWQSRGLSVRLRIQGCVRRLRLDRPPAFRDVPAPGHSGTTATRCLNSNPR